jgi:FMN reductase
VNNLIAINASHSSHSTTHHLAALAVEIHGSGRVVDLATLDPAALCGFGSHHDVRALLGEITVAAPLVLVTPVYRATYSGLLKVLFDQLAPGGLRDVPCVLAASAASPAHYLAIDTGLRSLVASLDGWSMPAVVYATPADFDSAMRPNDDVRRRMTEALDQAGHVRRAHLIG